VGVPLENHTLVDQGAVNVIFGSWTGLTREGDHFLTVGTTAAFNHGQLGYALAAGDINGDGYADLAIGAPIGLNGEGFVAVTYGGPGGPGALFVHRQIVDPPETGDLLGYAVAIGDFNNDGFGDVAAGAPGEDSRGLVNAGAVSVFYGQAGFGLSRQEIWDQESDGVDDSPNASDFFGLSLTVGDYNSDGFADLAIGVPHEDRGGFVDAGLTNVIIGLPTGLSGGADYLLIPDDRQTNALFGRSVR
jgi:FG-GAP repeat